MNIYSRSSSSLCKELSNLSLRFPVHKPPTQSIFRKKVAAYANHFVGDGGTTKDVNENNTVTNMHELLSIHMPAYNDSIIKGVASVMASYSSWNGRKMHADHDLVTGFLKDWQGIDRLTSPPHANYTYSVETSILAGVDMVMVPYNFTEFINDLTYLVKNNFIPTDRIDDAVERILSVKFTMGLFANPYTDFSLINEVGNQVGHYFTLQASVTIFCGPGFHSGTQELSKRSCAEISCAAEEWENLPLPKKVSRILIAGSHADNLGYQCGGWTITWQGFCGNDATSGTIKSAVDPGTEVIYVENPDSKYATSSGFDYAIVVVGEHTCAESAGDSTPTLTMADPGPDVINYVCQSQPGTEGQGITDLLFGD
ncbi:hypothetical protein KY284_028397 [Solanum tuberosum]|nr:hypothetical protein KY284_028397 [Solanum tuberosum]